jgi:hypothetical protein
MLGQAFCPVSDADGSDFGDTVAITITAGSTATQILNATQSTTQWRIFNSGTAIAFITPAPTQALAVVVIPTAGTPGNGMPIAPGEDAIFTVPPGAAWLGVFGSAANGTLYVTVGEGI